MKVSFLTLALLVSVPALAASGLTGSYRGDAGPGKTCYVQIARNSPESDDFRLAIAQGGTLTDGQSWTDRDVDDHVPASLTQMRKAGSRALRHRLVESVKGDGEMDYVRELDATLVFGADRSLLQVQFVISGDDDLPRDPRCRNLKKISEETPGGLLDSQFHEGVEIEVEANNLTVAQPR